MPELAEVEYYRHRWDAGAGQRIEQVLLHPHVRDLRGTDCALLVRRLTGARLLDSKARGKQMLFRATGPAWLGLHLGMTGQLSVGPADHAPGRHDHLVLRLRRCALVFTDHRQFGRIRFHVGETAPEWWAKLPPAVTSDAFTLDAMTAFLRRRARLPLKAALLQQEHFPGIGNWMADEILWRARLAPTTLAGQLNPSQFRQLWRQIRWVSRRALELIAPEFDDPPKGWLFNERWGNKGVCPRDRIPLTRATIGGRTTAWCARCQPQAA